MKILSGKKIAQEILASLKQKVAKMEKKPTLAIILVGDDPASKIYIHEKQKKAKEIGIGFKLIKLPADVETQEVIKTINELDLDQQISGILIQLPLPQHLDRNKIVDAIALNKDVDGLRQGVTTTAEAIYQLLASYNIDPAEKNVAILGAGFLVGKPTAKLLAQKGAKVDIIDKRTLEPKKISQKADIVITATGQPELIDSTWIKEGAIVVDAGSPKPEINLDIKNKASALSPVPRGIGPITVALLLKRLVEIS